MKTIIVTGSAGFIGYHLSDRLLRDGYRVIGIDNINHYYDPALKTKRLERLGRYPEFVFHKTDITDFEAMKSIFHQVHPDRVCHLAAQAGVRHSLTHPEDYIHTNLTGFFNVIELSKQIGVENFVYASSSSVYGNNPRIPFSESDRVDTPISLYAATKISNELIAYNYSHLYQLPTTGLRFFTAYGPWGRPDMALFIFTRAILAGKPIQVYNYGQMKRDFTYIDDIVSGITAALDHPFPVEVFNLGNHHPVELAYFIELIEQALGKKAIRELMPLQAGDISQSSADIEHARQRLGYNPSTPVEVGVRAFIAWYMEHYHPSNP